MKSTVCFILLLTCLSLNAFSDNVMAFMQIPPSSISRAMGGGFIGVADVWHSSPFVAWDNPAMPAMHEGIGFGFTRYDYFNSNNIPDYPYNVGMATISYKGIGLLLPSLNPHGNAGTYFDFSNEHYIGGGGGTNYYSAAMYGISFNPLKFLRETRENTNKYDWLDVSAGLAYTQMANKYWIGPPCKLNTYVHSEISILDAGLLAKAKKQISEKVLLEGSLGYKRYNLTNEKQKFPDIIKSYYVPVGQNDVYGLGIGISIPRSASNHSFPLKEWTDNLATVRILTDRNSSHNIEQIYNAGIELGCLDTFYLRGGYYIDTRSKYENHTTWGFGVNLHNKDLWALEFNFSRDSHDDYIGNMDSWDAMLRIDGVKLIKNILERRS